MGWLAWESLGWASRQVLVIRAFRSRVGSSLASPPERDDLIQVLCLLYQGVQKASAL